jgi:hypothetical protein
LLVVAVVYLCDGGIEWKFRVSRPLDAQVSFLGFRLVNFTPDIYTGEAIARIPYWSLLALLSPLVVLYGGKRRHPDGLCPACGYSLTGNVSGACPECRTPTNTTKGAA